jgi:sulfur carrier protein
MDKNIKVTINGEEREIPGGLTVAGLLDYLNVKHAAAIVEHNLAVLKKDLYGDTQVRNGDKLEIVRFVGGG